MWCPWCPWCPWCLWCVMIISLLWARRWYRWVHVVAPVESSAAMPMVAAASLPCLLPPPPMQDSIGGNSKTFIVATVSPSDDCMGETLSALKFAQRAKMVKVMAVSGRAVVLCAMVGVMGVSQGVVCPSRHTCGLQDCLLCLSVLQPGCERRHDGDRLAAAGRAEGNAWQAHGGKRCATQQQPGRPPSLALTDAQCAFANSDIPGLVLKSVSLWWTLLAPPPTHPPTRPPSPSLSH